ncbi:MAG TPA: hypothetical protein VHB79_19590 [Polyangiaceae bacterium]|nr:hypothetical protein [Polyangiaceae bacterium]
MLQGDTHQVSTVGAGRIHVARLCVLFVALMMVAGSVLTPLLLDESPPPKLLQHVLLGSLPALTMLGCLAWSRRKPGIALLVAAVAFSAVAGTNVLGLPSGNSKTVGIAVVGAVTVVILRGAYSGLMAWMGRR